MPEDKTQAALKKISKKYPGLITDLSRPKPIDACPTGIAMIDALTGIRGLPRGRIIELYGNYSTGKSSCALQLVAHNQQLDPNFQTLYLDYEASFDQLYAKKLGVDLNRLIVASPEVAEEGIQLVYALLDEDALDCVILDSYTAMVPRDIFEDDEKNFVGLHSRYASRVLNTIKSKIASLPRKPLFMVINQVRANMQGGGSFKAAAEKSASGYALSHLNSLRLKFEIIKRERDPSSKLSKGRGERFTSNRVRIECDKNKVGIPHLFCEIVVNYGQGIDRLDSLLTFAEDELKLISPQGYWAFKDNSTGEELKGRGRDTLLSKLRASPHLVTQIEQQSLTAQENRIKSQLQQSYQPDVPPIRAPVLAPSGASIPEGEEVTLGPGELAVGLDVLDSDDEEPKDLEAMVLSAEKHLNIRQGTAWFKYTPETGNPISVKGRKAFMAILTSRPEVMAEIQSKLKELTNA